MHDSKEAENERERGMDFRRRKPSWLRKKIEYSSERHELGSLLGDLGLNTVCRSARCPNLSECYKKGRATFLILGDRCTRGCTFCAIDKASGGEELGLSDDEPARLVEAVRKLGLLYVVITSVTRDDLDDGGAAQFARSIRMLRDYDPDIGIEVLTPDFMGNRESIDTVAREKPDVFNHNVETVPRLYPPVRPGADYERSLSFIGYIHDRYPGLLLKSGIMVGLGETEDEVEAVLRDLRSAGCDAVTIGHYIRPSKANIPVYEYIAPAVFSRYEAKARELGFSCVASGPFVRSSYMAHEGYETMRKTGLYAIDRDSSEALY